MNEAPAPVAPGTTVFDSMLGAAFLRWCPPLLGLEPFADPDAYVERRRALGAREVATRMLRASGVTDVLVDTGLNPGGVTSPGETAAFAGGRGHEVVRLEHAVEAALAGGVPPADVADELRRRLTGSGAVAAKSIAAYRVGLALPGSPPTETALAGALATVRPGDDGAFRVSHPVVSAWLAHEAMALGFPLQVHVGYGDADLDLARCDPLLLTDFLRATRDRGVPVLLLHTYPFHRHAAYLAQVFPHVWIDVGLATHNAGALSTAVTRETLELVPFHKLLYSSDAYGLAELFYLGSHLFWRGLERVLADLVDATELDAGGAERVRALVAHENAERVYRLG